MKPIEPEELNATENSYITGAYKKEGDKFYLPPDPNATVETGKHQLKKDLNRNLKTNNPNLLDREDPSFNLFARCYNQTLLSFIVNSINQAFGNMGFMATGYHYTAKLDENPLSLTVENNFLLIGRPQEEDQHFIPGKIKIIFTLGEKGIELSDIQTSSNTLKMLVLGLVKVANKSTLFSNEEILSTTLDDLSFAAKMEESPENIYASYRALVFFLNHNANAPRELIFLQKTLSDITNFMNANPNLVKDNEFKANLKAIDPRTILRNEIEKIEHTGLKKFHLEQLDAFLVKNQINNLLFDNIKLFVTALNTACKGKEQLPYKDYMKVHQRNPIPFGAVGEDKYILQQIADKENLSHRDYYALFSPISIDDKKEGPRRSPLSALRIPLSVR